jgi:hypothetical protein
MPRCECCASCEASISGSVSGRWTRFRTAAGTWEKQSNGDYMLEAQPAGNGVEGLLLKTSRDPWEPEDSEELGPDGLPIIAPRPHRDRVIDGGFWFKPGVVQGLVLQHVGGVIWDCDAATISVHPLTSSGFPDFDSTLASVAAPSTSAFAGFDFLSLWIGAGRTGVEAGFQRNGFPEVRNVSDDFLHPDLRYLGDEFWRVDGAITLPKSVAGGIYGTEGKDKISAAIRCLPLAEPGPPPPPPCPECLEDCHAQASLSGVSFTHSFYRLPPERITIPLSGDACLSSGEHLFNSYDGSVNLKFTASVSLQSGVAVLTVSLFQKQPHEVAFDMIYQGSAGLNTTSITPDPAMPHCCVYSIAVATSRESMDLRDLSGLAGSGPLTIYEVVVS